MKNHEFTRAGHGAPLRNADMAHNSAGHPDHGPHRGHGGGHRHGHGGRGRRGDVRNSILALIAESPMNGYQLIQAIAERSQGLWKPGAGSIYPALGLLVDEGMLIENEIDGKKSFSLSEAGKNYCNQNAAELAAPWERVAGPGRGVPELRQEMKQLDDAVRHVAMGGDTDAMAKVRDILSGARKDIYRLLAD